PSQAGCIYYLHHFSCQAFLQFFLNLFLTDTAGKTNSNCAKTCCSSDLPNYCLAASLDQSAHSTD
ncbi:MAG: hypothetical protein ACI9MS_001151, partial [Glaciecola sp.]